MRRLFFLISSLLLFFTKPIFPAFEGESDFVSPPISFVSAFIPSNYVQSKQLLFSTSGSRLYSMQECNDLHTDLLVFFPFAAFGADISFLGSELYSETQLAISILKGTSPLFGLKLKLMRLGIKGYYNRFYGSDDFFFLSQTEYFSFLSTYANALPFGYKFKEEKPISTFSSLLRIYPSNWTSFNIKILFSELTGTGFELGSSVKLTSIFSFGGGFSLATKAISSTAILSLSKFDLSYNISIHPELGLTHKLGLVFSKSKKLGTE